MLSQMRKHMNAIIIGITALFVLSCFAMYGFGFGNSTTNNSGSKRDYVVATLEGRNIMRSEIEQGVARLAEMSRNKDITSNDMKELRKAALNQIVLDVEMNKEIKSRKIKVADEDVRDAFDKIVATFPTKEEFMAQMERYGITEEALKRDIKTDLLRNKLIETVTADVEVTTRDAKMFYEKHTDLYTRPAGILADVVVVKDKSVAESIKKEIDGGMKWTDMVKKNAENIISASDAEMHDVITAEAVKQIKSFAAIKNFTKNKISGVIEMPEVKGFYLAINRGNVEEKVLSYEEAEKDIKARLREMRIMEYRNMYLMNLVKLAKIKVKDATIFPEVKEPVKTPVVSTDVKEK